jgi:hypothetical protein
MGLKRMRMGNSLTKDVSACMSWDLLLYDFEHGNG